MHISTAAVGAYKLLTSCDACQLEKKIIIIKRKTIKTHTHDIIIINYYTSARTFA